MPQWQNPNYWDNKYPETKLPPWADAFVQWLILPTWERVPKLQSEFAREWKIQAGELSKIKKDPRFKDELQKRADNYNLSPERVQEVMNALHRSAVGGDTKAMSLFLQHADRLAPRRVEIVDNRVLDQFSDAEIAQLFEEAT